MNEESRREAERVVVEALHEIVVHDFDATNFDQFILDLMLDEDATYGFIPMVQKALNIRLPNSEWERVQTIEEAIDALARGLELARGA